MVGGTLWICTALQSDVGLCLSSLAKDCISLVCISLNSFHFVFLSFQSSLRIINEQRSVLSGSRSSKRLRFEQTEDIEPHAARWSSRNCPLIRSSLRFYNSVLLYSSLQNFPTWPMSFIVVCFFAWMLFCSTAVRLNLRVRRRGKFQRVARA